MDAACRPARRADLLGGWLLSVGYCGVRVRLDRRRLATWERDWATIEPRWRNSR